MKQQDLKRKLKASDRRRRRRSGTASTTSEGSAGSEGSEGTAGTAGTASSSSASSPKKTDTVDVSGLVVDAILDFANSSRTGTCDAAVVAAIGSCLRASSPGGQQSALLRQRLDAISGLPGVDTRTFRDSLRALMDLAKRHHDPKNATAFLSYLSVLVG